MNALDYLEMEVGHFVDFFQGPDIIDQRRGESIDDEIQDSIRGGDALALEEVQLLNDLAGNGQIDASLQLFNMYLQGAEEMGVDRDLQVANQYLGQINEYIDQNGLANLDPGQVYNLGYAEVHNNSGLVLT